jgi:hypothetical protein
MIRKGEGVGYSVYVMHRLKKLYGDDAESFRPERWDPDVDNKVDLKNIGWGYLPFNGGPRVCLGRKSFFFHQHVRGSTMGLIHVRGIRVVRGWVCDHTNTSEIPELPVGPQG